MGRFPTLAQLLGVLGTIPLSIGDASLGVLGTLPFFSLSCRAHHRFPPSTDEYAPNTPSPFGYSPASRRGRKW